ncbi:MAG: hypothetical protein ABIU05_16660 [Nitrospirales bacterium]
MPTAHLYLFSDACPTDWLVDGKDETWHTIVNFVFQSSPDLQQQVESGAPHMELLALDGQYMNFVRTLESCLSSHQLKKWKTSLSYKLRFCRAFAHVIASIKPIVSACSFQEKTLRSSKRALLASYDRHVGGIEGRGIGFEEWLDDRGRPRMKHSFVNMNGYHEIQGLENQVLVLLFMSWFAADQYTFYKKDIVSSSQCGFDRLAMTVVSDKLSGDDDSRRNNEQNLRNLIDPEGENTPIVLTRSPDSDSFSGDLIVDNLAGWLNAAVADPSGSFGDAARDVAGSGVWSGWHVLKQSSTKLESVPAISRLQERQAG